MHRKLYYSALSPYARKVRILLSEFDLEFESDKIERMRTIDEIGPINPNLSIPVLEDGENTLFDSSVICEYLLETYKGHAKKTESAPPLYHRPYREEKKWDDLKLLATLETLTESLISIFLFTHSMQTAGVDPDQIGYLDRQRARVGKTLDWLDSQVAQKGFYPDYFSLLDITLISAVDFCEVLELYPWRGRSNLEALHAFHLDRPSVASSRP